MYEFHPSEQGEHEHVSVVLPSRKSQKLAVGPPFKGIFTVNEDVQLPDIIPPRIIDPKTLIVQPQTLNHRFVPFGAQGEKSGQSGMSEKKKKKKERKSAPLAEPSAPVPSAEGEAGDGAERKERKEKKEKKKSKLAE